MLTALVVLVALVALVTLAALSGYSFASSQHGSATQTNLLAPHISAITMANAYTFNAVTFLSPATRTPVLQMSPILGTGLRMPVLSATSNLPVDITPWLVLAILAVLLVLVVAAFVYMLSNFSNSPNMRAWARSQIYESLITLLIIAAFIAIVAIILSFNPSNLPQSQFIPKDCTGSNWEGWGTATNVFDLATCDIQAFNVYSLEFFSAIYTTVSLASLMSIGFNIGIDPCEMASVPNTHCEISFGLDSVLPVSMDTDTAFMISALVVLFIMNQVQTAILAGSLLWFAFFVTLGLVARAFGISRTFGGAMIAMGLGLGLVYPLLAMVTYGTIVTSFNAYCGSSGCSASTLDTMFSGSLLTAIFGIISGSGWTSMYGGILYLALAIAGMTFIPFMNFVVLDAFIVDFSKSIGERLDFVTIMTGLV